MFEPCTEVVTILTALIFGAGDACVDIGLRSVLPALLVFVVCVVVLQFLARRLLSRLFGRRKPTRTATPTRARKPLEGPEDDGGPIRSMR